MSLAGATFPYLEEHLIQSFGGLNEVRTRSLYGITILGRNARRAIDGKSNTANRFADTTNGVPDATNSVPNAADGHS